jgi:pyruvate dehydrogenase E2 component (dihydrolipoamide acetyltransferase)
MPDAITLPQLGESVTEGVIVAWLVEVGDVLEVDQPLAEISTDKVDTEIPAPLAGRVHALRANVDETVEVGQVIAEVVAEVAVDPAGADGDAPSAAPGPRAAEEVAAPGGGDDEVPASSRISPKVRRLLRERSLDLDDIRGSGRGGRVTPTDVEAATAADRSAPTVPAPAHAATAAVAEPPVAATTTRPSAGRSDGYEVGSDGRETVALSRVRRTIADRMHRSLATTAQLTAVVEVDMTRLMASRAEAKDTVRRREGVALTPLSLTARAVCEVLGRHPVLNAEIDTDAGTATYHRDVHLGIAVDTDAGLIVPTIREAQLLTVPALARRIAGLAERSRSRELSPDDLLGGTFTLTNTGSRGVLIDTPILNPPQVAILATTLIEKRPVVVTDGFGMDTFAARQMSYLCLTYDHRLVSAISKPRSRPATSSRATRTERGLHGPGRRRWMVSGRRRWPHRPGPVRRMPAPSAPARRRASPAARRPGSVDATRRPHGRPRGSPPSSAPRSTRRCRGPCGR